MNIQSINRVNTNQKSTNFRAAYPVVHWVAESNGSFAPVANLQIVKKLQRRIVGILNKPLVNSKKPMNPLEQRIRTYIAACDVNYRCNPTVRSFYNRISGDMQHFIPISYVISGNDVGIFEDAFTKNIGRAKSCGTSSPATNDALKMYHRNGLDFVRNDERQLQDSNKMPYMLHTKFEIVRNTLGKIKDYKLLDVRFLPAKGAKNPLEKYQK